MKFSTDAEECQIIKATSEFNPDTEITCLSKYFEPLNYTDEKSKTNKPSVEQPPKLELKTLPEQLKYAYLGDDNTLPVIISSKLQPEQEAKFIDTLRQHKKALGWIIADKKGISPAICMHKILLEDNHKPTVDAQRRLNQGMKDVDRKEILKWLDAGIIYPISDRDRVNQYNVSQRREGLHGLPKLNKATRKDHFPLPFIDQMLDRLVGKAFQYCLEIFMDDFSTFGDDFTSCLNNLKKISSHDMEIDIAKIDVINKLPPPATIKGHTEFEFDDACTEAFEVLKKKLVTTSIVATPDWTLTFEVMCDANNYAVGTVLRQHKEKIFHPIKKSC
ncbi:hypothetical protein GQ457_16G016980 [Hibiscus cannabinus]